MGRGAPSVAMPACALRHDGVGAVHDHGLAGGVAGVGAGQERHHGRGRRSRRSWRGPGRRPPRSRPRSAGWGLTAAGADDLDATLGEAHRDALADALAGAGDDGDLLVELLHVVLLSRDAAKTRESNSAQFGDARPRRLRRAMGFAGEGFPPPPARRASTLSSSWSPAVCLTLKRRACPASSRWTPPWCALRAPSHVTHRGRLIAKANVRRNVVVDRELDKFL